MLFILPIVVNRNYLDNAFKKTNDIIRYMGAFFTEEKVVIIRVIRNKQSSYKMYKLQKSTHVYFVMQLKEFFNKDYFNELVMLKNDGCKIFLMVEGVGLALLKVIFKTFGIVFNRCKNNLKGNLSPTPFK